MLSARPPYVRRLVYITAGFILVVGGLIVASEQASGWNGLTYIVLAMGTMALWAQICVIYAIWVLIRDGRQRSNIPALVIVVVAIVLGGIWMVGGFH
jgi:hypothetical protein